MNFAIITLDETYDMDTDPKSLTHNVCRFPPSTDNSEWQYNRFDAGRSKN